MRFYEAVRYAPAVSYLCRCRQRYETAGAYSILHTYKYDYCWTCQLNSCADLTALFDKAKAENVFIEGVFLESVMGEGNPGVALNSDFYALASKLVSAQGGALLIDNIQAGIRTTGNLSIVDYPGFEKLPPPDFEVYSKALNAGQYPISCLAMSPRGRSFYKHGVYVRVFSWFSN